MAHLGKTHQSDLSTEPSLVTTPGLAPCPGGRLEYLPDGQMEVYFKVITSGHISGKKDCLHRISRATILRWLSKSVFRLGGWMGEWMRVLVG